MGAGGSWSMAGEGNSGDQSARPTGLGDLPEACAAEILARLEPREICRLARLSRSFRTAASADFIWEEKLPRNYKSIVERVLIGSGGQDPKSKKELYARLCHHTFFEGGTMEFWLEKHSGGICVSISSKALSITMIDDRRYWNYVPTEESRVVSNAKMSERRPASLA